MLIEKSDDAHQVWVFRTPSEKWKTEYMAPKKRAKRPMQGYTLHLKLLEYLVLPVVQRVNDTIGDAVFQQGNAPVHTSIVTEQFEQQNIQVDEHPPYSLDLWRVMGRRRSGIPHYDCVSWSGVGKG